MANLYIIVNMYVCLHLRSVVNATAHARCDIFNRFTIEQSVKVLLSGVQYESWLFLSTHSRTCVLFAVIHFWAVWLTASTKIGIKTCGIINAVKGTSYLRHFVFFLNIVFMTTNIGLFILHRYSNPKTICIFVSRAIMSMQIFYVTMNQ